jgi:hypothetical protein
MVTAPTTNTDPAVTSSSTLRQTNGTSQLVATCEICKTEYVPKSKEVHCSAACLVRALALYPRGKGKSQKCPVCHGRFKARHPTQRYDTRECHRAASNAAQTVKRHEAKKKRRKCPTCRASFTSRHSRQRYCKTACRPSSKATVRQPDKAEPSPGKLCKQCGTPFVGHGNRKYCDGCTYSKAKQTECAYLRHNPNEPAESWPEPEAS